MNLRKCDFSSAQRYSTLLKYLQIRRAKCHQLEQHLRRIRWQPKWHKPEVIHEFVTSFSLMCRMVVYHEVDFLFAVLVSKLLFEQRQEQSEVDIVGRVVNLTEHVLL